MIKRQIMTKNTNNDQRTNNDQMKNNDQKHKQ